MDALICLADQLLRELIGWRPRAVAGKFLATFMLRLLLPRAAPSNNLVWRGDRGGHVPERGGLLSGRLWLEKFLTVLTPCRMHPPNSWSGISSGQTCIRVSQFSQLSWPLPVSFQGHFLFNLPLAPLMTQVHTSPTAHHCLVKDRTWGHWLPSIFNEAVPSLRVWGATAPAGQEMQAISQEWAVSQWLLGEHMDKAFTVTMLAPSVMVQLSAQECTQAVVLCECDQRKGGLLARIFPGIC